MQQADATKISNKILADKMNTLKKGRSFEKMCKEIEELTANITSEQRIIAAEAVLAVSADEKTAIKVIAEKFGVSEEEAQKIVAKARKN